MIRFLLIACLALASVFGQSQNAFVVKTTAELVRLNPKSYPIVVLTNGMIYRGDSTSFATANGGSVLTPVSPFTGRWILADGVNNDFESVKNFGAIPDDSIDDTASISNAVVSASASGKTLIYPPGTYRQSTVVLRNIRVLGYGATIYQISIPDVASNYGTLSGTPGAPAIYPKLSPAFYAYRGTNVTIEGFRFTSAPTAEFFGGAQSAIHTYFAEDVMIQNCFFTQTNNFYCVSISASKNVTVRDCDFGQSIFQSGQGNLLTDTFWDASYDSSTTYGIENLIVSENKFSGTNSAVRSRLFMSGVQSFKITDNLLDNVQTMGSLIHAYCGDRGLHYYDGTTASNANWIVSGNIFAGQNTWFSNTLGSAIKIIGNSATPNAGFPDTLKTYTAYGSVVRDNVLQGGSGIVGLWVATPGVEYQRNKIEGQITYSIFAGAGYSSDCSFVRNILTTTSPVNALMVTVDTVTNANWVLDGNILMGSAMTPQMLWHPTHPWDNLTLRNNVWINQSTNLPGATDSLWRMVYTNKFTVQNERIVLLSTNNWWDTNVFDISPTVGASLLFKEVKIIPATTAMPIYGGVFSGDFGVFEDNEIGSARFSFTTRAMLRHNRFASTTVSRPIVRSDTPEMDMDGNWIEQLASGAAVALWKVGDGTNRIHSRSDTIRANTTAAAVATSSVGAIEFSSLNITNIGSANLYEVSVGSINIVKRDRYPFEIERPESGSFAFNVNNEWGSDQDIQIIPIPGPASGGVAAYYSISGGASRFGFGVNPLSGNFEVGTNGAARPFLVNKDGITSIGGAPHASAALDVASVTKGLLPPRMTKAQRDAVSTPADGLVIYQTDNTPGIRLYEAGAWVRPTVSADP